MLLYTNLRKNQEIELDQEIYWPKDGTAMRLIPAGNFEMDDPICTPSPKWNLKVKVGGFYLDWRIPLILDAFYMDIHEVIVEKYKKFSSETGRTIGVSGKVLNYPNL